MLQTDFIRKALSELNTKKCTKNNCKSHNKGQLQIIWFGKQYQNKQITCTSCYVMDNQAINKSIPTNLNVLPLYNFIEILIKQYKTYEQRKKQATWMPIIVKNNQKQIMDELRTFQSNLYASLKALQISLQAFLKKIMDRTKQIFTNETFSSIIQMNNKSVFDELLNKIKVLVQYLNYSDLNKVYSFEKAQVRIMKIQKLKQKINEINSRTLKVLQSLMEQLRQKNDNIKKI